ncbi:MAG: hypothetical protein U5K51_02575 [Flavobacteriaceae bacterium]|nr:hypothetical protein [Flavobacteriaceae bacterium]
MLFQTMMVLVFGLAVQSITTCAYEVVKSSFINNQLTQNNLKYGI